MRIDGFDWDDGNWPKCAKHGLTKEDLESVFTTDSVLGVSRERGLVGRGAQCRNRPNSRR